MRNYLVNKKDVFGKMMNLIKDEYDERDEAYNVGVYACIDIVTTQPTVDPNPWIPCGERLPEEGGDYLCYEEYEPNKFDIFIEEIDCDGIFKQWNITNSERIIAWQPLPQPYNRKEN